AQHRRHEETQRQAEAEARLAKEKQEAQRNAALAKKEAEEEHRRQQEELARRNREEQREAERKVQEAKRQAEAEARLAKAEEAQHRRHEETQRQAEAEARLAKEKQEAQRNAALAKKEAEARLNKEKAALERKLALASNTDLNKKVQVAEDGSFEFPLIGPVHAAGHSLQEIQQEIQDRLNREYLVNPQVSIRPTNAKFSVLGEVSRPGSYLIEGAMDVLTAISLAGGITKFGSSRVDVIRGEEEEKVTIRTNVDAIIKGSEPNVDIMPHDTVYVRRRIF
ncbi:MAG: polysaccharide biosynthesis/export family protein, partial [Candidatus Omnitrophica bacterium]|nr:polysaccharide biosynthesis/export family protein [Candidatus Omnitrophota bacterium]